MLFLGACGTVQPGAVSSKDSSLTSENGLSTNGLSTNGLSTNGLSTNGLSTNGLSTNGFSSWFNANTTNGNMVMKYVAKCALAPGTSLDWTNPMGGSHSWPGELGLAPGWTGGSAATTTEQQLISACLAAHTNKYGLQVDIAVEGTDATGTQLPIESGELTTYSVHEGCFFGNLFASEGVYVGLDHGAWDTTRSSSRACALSSSNQCSPIVSVGSCADYCQIDSTGTYYSSCSYNGTTYIPVTTRLQPETIYQCGDGVCQFTESCGNGTTYDSCLADCGQCP